VNATDASERTEQVLVFIEAYMRDHGYAPSRREVAKAMGVSVCTAQRDLASLREDGLVDWTEGVNRSLVLVEQDLNARWQPVAMTAGTAVDGLAGVSEDVGVPTPGAARTAG